MRGFEDEAKRGGISADQYLKEFGRRMEYPLTTAQWIEARRIATEPGLTVLSLARQLGAHSLVGMFTNTPWLLKRHIGESSPRSRRSSASGRSSPPSWA